MVSKAVIGVGFLAAVLLVVEAWPSKLYDNSYNVWSPSRRSHGFYETYYPGHINSHVLRLKRLLESLESRTLTRNGNHFSDTEGDSGSQGLGCLGSGGECYASGQCCKGFVCAAVDDLYGENPEIPGFCVKEKDLRQCEVDDDCGKKLGCVYLARLGQRYCIPRQLRPEPESLPKQKYPTPKKGLGVVCEDDSDCAAFTKDGNDRLCCQEIRRYRQKASKRCDRVTPISVCIGPNKVRK